MGKVNNDFQHVCKENDLMTMAQYGLQMGKFVTPNNKKKKVLAFIFSLRPVRFSFQHSFQELKRYFETSYANIEDIIIAFFFLVK